MADSYKLETSGLQGSEDENEYRITFEVEWQPAEPDVGIMSSYPEEVTVTKVEIETIKVQNVGATSKVHRFWKDCPKDLGSLHSLWDFAQEWASTTGIEKIEQED